VKDGTPLPPTKLVFGGGGNGGIYLMPTSPKKFGPPLSPCTSCPLFFFTIFDLVWNNEHEMWGHRVTKVIKKNCLYDLEIAFLGVFLSTHKGIY